MRIEITTEEWDGGERGCIEIAMRRDTNAAMSLRFRDGEPEDNNLMRNFSDCYMIHDALLMAYAAGAAGETLDVVEQEAEEEL